VIIRRRNSCGGKKKSLAKIIWSKFKIAKKKRPLKQMLGQIGEEALHREVRKGFPVTKQLGEKTVGGG